MLRVRASVLLPAICLLLLTSSPAGAGDESPKLRPVASTIFRGPKNNGLIGGPSRTDLLVAGDVTRVEKGEGSVRVAESFYDRAPSEHVTFAAWFSVRTGPRILALEARRSKRARWARVECVPDTPTNRLAARALGEARLALHALGASLVFVGRETSLASTHDIGRGRARNDVRSVVVDRMVLGSPDLEGQTIRILGPWLSESTEHEPILRSEQRIYFIGWRGPDEPPPEVKGTEGSHCYRARASVALAQLPDVEAALEQRARHPIVTIERWGHRKPGENTERVREICFLGPVEDALTMVGTDLERGYVFASRSLALRPEESRSLVADAIRGRMTDHRVGPRDRHELLRRLIRTLGRIEREAPTGALDALVVEYLDLLRSSRTLPAPPASYPSAPGSEADRTDVNRALVWLLAEIGREDALRHAEIIRSDRNALRGQWKREMQIALDFLAVEDTEALLEALRRGRERPEPVRRQIVESGDQAAVFALAHRSNLLALEGAPGLVRLRDPLTWGGRDIETLERIEGLAFSLDDVHLFVAGSGGTLQRHVVATGERDLVYTGHNEEIQDLHLTPDGQVLATYSDKGALLVFHDAKTGETLGREEVEGYRMRPSIDGRGVVVHSLSADRVFEERYVPIPGRPGPTAETPIAFPSGGAPTAWGRSPDGRWFCCANQHHVRGEESQDAALVLYERAESGYREVARAAEDDVHAFRAVEISPDGRHVVTGGRHGTVRIYTIPTLEEVLCHRFHRGMTNDWMPWRLAFSADARLLVAGFEWAPTPGLVRLDTREVIHPWVGHSDDVVDVFHSEDGRELRTLGRDEDLCRWDARTLAAIDRHELPDGFEALLVQPGGEKILCLEEGLWDDGPPRWPAGRKAEILDASTGLVWNTFTLPHEDVRWRAWWVPGQDALILDHDETLMRLDARTGTVTRRVPYARGGRGGIVEEDGRHLYRPGRNRKNWCHVEAQRIDMETGASERILPENERTIRARKVGLIPNGRTFFLAEPGLRVLERDSCEEVFHLPLVGVDLDVVTPNADGSRLALLSSGTLPKAIQKAVDAEAASILRILDAGTSETLLAFPFPGWGREAQFSPDGKRVAVLTRSGALYVWNL